MVVAQVYTETEKGGWSKLPKYYAVIERPFNFSSVDQFMKAYHKANPLSAEQLKNTAQR